MGEGRPGLRLPGINNVLGQVAAPTKPPVPLRDVETASRFRVIYAPPGKAETEPLKNAALLWHGRLPSPAFGGGRVD